MHRRETFLRTLEKKILECVGKKTAAMKKVERCGSERKLKKKQIKKSDNHLKRGWGTGQHFCSKPPDREGGGGEIRKKRTGVNNN